MGELKNSPNSPQKPKIITALSIYSKLHLNNFGVAYLNISYLKVYFFIFIKILFILFAVFCACLRLLDTVEIPRLTGVAVIIVHFFVCTLLSFFYIEF